MGQELTKLTPEELKARQIKEMDVEMKQKLQRGANYNMKVVIKGDRNTGKTCLWRRLQRMAFIEDYKGTDQIQIATIAWDYKTTSDKIKVEVWDVVDKASKRKESGSLKIGIEGEDGLDVDDDDEQTDEKPKLPSAAPGAQGSFAVDKLDAETVDVYKNCNAVLFTMDPRKKWTFEYIEREMPNVPKNTFVLILVNYRDCPQNQRVITEYEMQEYARNCGKFVRCIECSMKNCYGMKGIRCFFNLPFLKLKRQYIIQQLKENEADLDAADQELDLVNKEQNYDFYLKWLEENRKNRKGAVPISTMLPEGPPPRASIDTSKGNDISSASLEEDSRMHVRDRSASAPHTPAQAAATPTRPAPPKQGSMPAVNAAVRGGIGTGGFGSYSQAFHMQSAPTTAAQSATPTRPPQPTTPQRPPTTPAPQQQPPPATPPKPAAPAEAGGGLMSWTSKLFSSSPAKPVAATPKREERDAVADLQKLAKDPAVRVASATSVEDFVPPTEGGDDFWGGDDDDDDDDDDKKGDIRDSDDEDGSSLIARDEDLDDDDDDDDSPPPMRKQPSRSKAEDDKAMKEKLKREREERERREREEKERERERKEREEKERRERERAQAEALRRQFELQESHAAASNGGGYDEVSEEPPRESTKTNIATKTPVPSSTNGKEANKKDKKEKKEKSIWGTGAEEDSDDSDDDDDDGAWGTPAKTPEKSKLTKKKSNPFIMNDEDIPSGDSDDASSVPAKPAKATSASMSSLPSVGSGETDLQSDRRDSSDRGRRREEREKDRESRRSKRREGGSSSSSYGDLGDAVDSPSSKERKERRHRHRDRDDKDREGGRSHRSHRSSKHRDENGGSGERESRRSSKHRHRSRSPSPVA